MSAADAAPESYLSDDDDDTRPQTAKVAWVTVLFDAPFLDDCMRMDTLIHALHDLDGAPTPQVSREKFGERVMLLGWFTGDSAVRTVAGLCGGRRYRIMGPYPIPHTGATSRDVRAGERHTYDERDTVPVKLAFLNGDVTEFSPRTKLDVFKELPSFVDRGAAAALIDAEGEGEGLPTFVIIKRDVGFLYDDNPLGPIVRLHRADARYLSAVNGVTVTPVGAPSPLLADVRAFANARGVRLPVSGWRMRYSVAVRAEITVPLDFKTVAMDKNGHWIPVIQRGRLDHAQIKAGLVVPWSIRGGFTPGVPFTVNDRWRPGARTQARSRGGARRRQWRRQWWRWRTFLREGQAARGGGAAPGGARRSGAAPQPGGDADAGQPSGGVAPGGSGTAERRDL